MPAAVWLVRKMGTEGSCYRGLSSSFPKRRSNGILEGFDADDKDLGRLRNLWPCMQCLQWAVPGRCTVGAGNKEGYMRRT